MTKKTKPKMGRPPKGKGREPFLFRIEKDLKEKLVKHSGDESYSDVINRLLRKWRP